MTAARVPARIMPAVNLDSFDIAFLLGPRTASTAGWQFIGAPRSSGDVRFGSLVAPKAAGTMQHDDDPNLDLKPPFPAGNCRSIAAPRRSRHCRHMRISPAWSGTVRVREADGCAELLKSRKS